EEAAAWRGGDVDGDGRQDLIYVSYTSPGSSLCLGPQSLAIDTFLSVGDGTWRHFRSPAFAASDVGCNSPAWQATDVNGDGRLDLAGFWRSPATGKTSVTTLKSGGIVTTNGVDDIVWKL